MSLSVCLQSGLLVFGVFFKSAFGLLVSVNFSSTCWSHGLLLCIMTLLLLIYACDGFNKYKKVASSVLECQGFELGE